MALADLTVTVADVVVKAVFLVLGFWLGYSSKRPTLDVQGVGSSGVQVPNKDVMTTYASIYNRSSFFGLPVNREAATIVAAFIYDPELEETVSSLLWLSDDGQKLIRECTIGSGRGAKIYLFAKERNSDEFFVFAPNNLNDELPKQLTKYKDKKKDFSLILVDVNRRRYTFELTVRNSPQNVSVRFPSHKLRARLDLLRRALGPM